MRTSLKSLKTPLLASMFSLAHPGLGHAYTGRLGRSIALGLTFPTLFLLLGWLKLPRTFLGLVAFVAITLSFQLFAAGDAWRKARSPMASQRANRWAVYTLLIMVAVAWNYVLESGVYFDRVLGMRLYGIPSSSMVPTLLVGERIAVDLRSYERMPPQRGDLVMIEVEGVSGPVMVIKRVVGIGGDTVSRTPEGVFLNDKRVCESNQNVDASGAPSHIPPQHFFVEGDNPLSYDSCYSEFRLFDLSSVKGRPLYIYWSAELSRVGRSL